MFYRLHALITFTDEPGSAVARKALSTFLSRAPIIRPATPLEEESYVMVEKCFHDEDPVKPCEPIFDSRTVL